MIRHCVVLSCMRRSILESGNPRQQALAWSALTDSEQFQGERRLLAAIVPLSVFLRHRNRCVQDARHIGTSPANRFVPLASHDAKTRVQAKPAPSPATTGSRTILNETRSTTSGCILTRLFTTGWLTKNAYPNGDQGFRRDWPRIDPWD